MELSSPIACDLASPLRLPAIPVRASNEESSSEPDCHRTLDCPFEDFDATPQSYSAETQLFDATPQSCWSQWDCCDYSKGDSSMLLMGGYQGDGGVVFPCASQPQVVGACDEPVFFNAFGLYPSAHDGNQASLMTSPYSQTGESYHFGPYYRMDPTIATDCTLATGPTQERHESLDNQIGVGCDIAQQHVFCCTTVMLRNIPGNYTNEILEEDLNEEGFAGCYDGAYMPKDLKNEYATLGYAFINFVSEEEATRFMADFNGFERWKNYKGKKAAETSWAKTQGLETFICQYQNSPIMHESIPECCKPRLFKDGKQINFPPPTKKLTPPKNIGKKKPAPNAEMQWQ